MKKSHKSEKGKEKFVPKEGQRQLLCDNKALLRCPSLDYEVVETTDSAIRVSRAFGLLFQEVIKIRQSKIKN